MPKVTNVSTVVCSGCGAVAMIIEWTCGCRACFGKHEKPDCLKKEQEETFFPGFVRKCPRRNCPVKG